MFSCSLAEHRLKPLSAKTAQSFLPVQVPLNSYSPVDGDRPGKNQPLESVKWYGMGVGKKRASPLTEKQEVTSGGLAHGIVCCQRMWRMGSLPSPPAVFAALYILPGRHLGFKGLRHRQERQQKHDSLWTCHIQLRSNNNLFACAWKWPLLIWYYSLYIYFFSQGMNCLRSFVIILCENCIDLWSSCWHRSNIHCCFLPIPVSTQKCISVT